MKKHRSPKKGNAKLIIGAIALVAVALIAIAVLILFAPSDGSDIPSDDTNEKSSSAEPEGTPSPSYNEGEYDPENLENEENGSDVSANELICRDDRSNGIDVSKWQGVIDWQSVKQSGIEFAFIRIGYRGENGSIYKDDYADYNIQQAQMLDIPIGVYFFSTAINAAEAKEEAEWVLDAVKGYPISYPVVYDCEGFKSSESRMYTLTAGERTENAVTFLDAVSEQGYETMIYVARNDAILHWSMARIPKKHLIWIAQYSDTPYPAQDKPDYFGRVDAWQYTNKGKVDGIEGGVDMVVCYFKCQTAVPKDPDSVPERVDVPIIDDAGVYSPADDTVTAKLETNLRTAATTKSEVVATLKNGETLTRTAIGTNGWSMLSYNGQTVFAITNYLTTDLDYSSPDVNTEYNIDGMRFYSQSGSVTAKELVNLRARPTTESEIIASLSRGEFLDLIAVSERGWSMLSYNGERVYAVSSYLTSELKEDDTLPPAEGFTEVDDMVTAKLETNLRTHPSTENSEIVYTLKNGEFVRRTGIHPNGWSRLEYNGQILYAVTSYLIEQCQARPPDTGGLFYVCIFDKI